MKDTNRYPPEWDSHKVQKVLKHYESQSDEDAAQEDDAAMGATAGTVMVIPNEFVPAVRALISKQ